MGGGGRRKGISGGQKWRRGGCGAGVGRQKGVCAFEELKIQQRCPGQFKSNKLRNAKQCSREQVNNEMKSKGHHRVQ